MSFTGPLFTYADALVEVASALFLLGVWVGRLEAIPILAFARSALYVLGPDSYI